MRSSDPPTTAGDPPLIAVVGATGTVGRAVCAALAAQAVPVRLIGRDPAALARLAASVPGATVRAIAACEPAQLAAALDGARVVINAAPLAVTAEPVVLGAIAAAVDYVDVGGEQAVLRELYERHESAVRRAGRVALPGAGVDCLLGDLAAAWAAAHLIGAADDADDPEAVVRSTPPARLADDRPLDDVTVSYVFDALVQPPGSQRAAFAAVGGHALVWRRDRWEAAAAGDHRRVNAGAELGGERDTVVHAGGDPITIPRHVATRRVTAQWSATRRPVAATALRLLARALPLVPARARALLVPYAPPDANYAATRLAVIAQVRRGFAAAQINVRGHDLVRTTAAIAAWAARALAGRATGPIGMRAPGELFYPAPALRAIARAAELTIEPSFA